jgi:tRNA-specific 2-thiouridylase
MVVIIGEKSQEAIEVAAEIAARYSKGKAEKTLKIKYGNYKKPFTGLIEVEPISEENLKKYMI